MTDNERRIHDPSFCPPEKPTDFPSFWHWWLYCMVGFIVGFAALGSVGTVIEFRAIHDFEVTQGVGLDAQTQFCRRFYENIAGWLWSDGQTYAGEFLNSWLDNSAIFAAGLFLGLFLGIVGLIGRVLWIAISKLRKGVSCSRLPCGR